MLKQVFPIAFFIILFGLLARCVYLTLDPVLVPSGSDLFQMLAGRTLILMMIAACGWFAHHWTKRALAWAFPE